MVLVWPEGSYRFIGKFKKCPNGIGLVNIFRNF